MTCDLPSGRRYGRISALRTSARRRASLCASEIGSGMSSGVSVQAYPNIMPWSPAPCVSRTSSSLTSVRTSRAVVHALADVRRLRVDGRDDAAGVAVEAVGGVVVADAAHGLARDLGDLDVGVGGDLAGDDDHPGRDQRLAGDAPVGVVGEDGVEDRVRDLVGDLVGVALGHRLRREQVVPLLHGAS